MRLLALLLILFTLGCQDSRSRQQARKDDQTVLRVATAANVQFAMEELAAAFQSDHGIILEPTISSSGKLTAQIIEGAPYHLLLSANMKYPNALVEHGAATGPVKIYAAGALVAWTLGETALEKEPGYLLSDRISKIAVANPRNAPYGQQAVRYLEYYSIKSKVSDKLVYGESIAQTNQYITSRAVDLGITAKSVAMSPKMRNKGRWVDLPAESYDPILQGAVVTSYGQEDAPDASALFLDYLSGAPARKIFQKHGYRTPE